eukprot:scaffold6686_cov85-Isochrysis_galbana.AAC.2
MGSAVDFLARGGRRLKTARRRSTRGGLNSLPQPQRPGATSQSVPPMRHLPAPLLPRRAAAEGRA